MRIAKFLCIALLIALTSFSNVALAEDIGHSDDTKKWPNQLRFIGGPNGGQWFTMGGLIAEIFSEKLIPTYSLLGGGYSNLASIDEKKGDFAFTLSCLIGAADSGEPEYQHLKYDDVVLMANVYPQILYFLIHKDFAEKHNITDVESLLKLKYPIRFASLKPGTASEFILNLLFKYGYNTSFDDLRKLDWQLTFGNYSEIADKFTEGEIDCFGYTAGTSVPLIKTMEDHVAITILPISQRVLDTLTKKFKTNTYTVQPEDYKSITEPIKTLGDYTVIITNKDLPSDLIYAINKTLWENKREITDVVVDFDRLNPETAILSGHKIHPGSLEFWNTFKDKF